MPLPSKIASSIATLPVAIAFFVVLWFVTSRHIAAMGIAALCIYLLMEINNRNALIRIRTRITSSVFAVGLPFLCSQCGVVGMTCAALIAAALFALFHCYDKREPVGSVFHCFTFLATASLLCPPLVILLPLFWLLLIIYIRTWSARIFSASILGMAFVAVLFVSGCITASVLDIQPGTRLLSAINHESLLSLDTYFPTPLFHLTPQLTYILVFGGIAAIAYAQQSYDDKIQVRMMNYCIATVWLIVMLLATLHSRYTDTLMPALWLTTAPLVAHQWAVARTWRTTAWACITVAALAAFLIPNT